MPAMNKLDTTQRWLTSIIIRPGKLQEKILAADATYKLHHEEVIRASAKLSAEKKISIYARGYVLRLMECMRADYPVLQHLLGEELFTVFVHRYLVMIPSHSPSLFDLGSNFPEFLKASQPTGNGQNDLFDLPVELAQVERTRIEVARSKGLEGINHTTPAGEQLLSFLSSSWKTSPALRLLQLKFSLLDFIKSVEKNEEAATPQQRINFLAISRKNYSVNMQELETWQWQYLQALQNENDHNAAIKHAAAASGLPEDSVMADVLLWIPVAVGLGYIYNTINN